MTPGVWFERAECGDTLSATVCEDGGCSTFPIVVWEHPGTRPRYPDPIIVRMADDPKVPASPPLPAIARCFDPPRDMLEELRCADAADGFDPHRARLP